MNRKMLIITAMMTIALVSVVGVSQTGVAPATNVVTAVKGPNSAAITNPPLGNTTNAPVCNVTLVKGTTEVVFMLETIVQYIVNNTIPLNNITSSGNVYFGINPLYLIQLLGWDARNISIVASDGFATEFDVSHFILRDVNFYKYSDNNATILAFAVNAQWLRDFSAADGDFRIIGDADLSGKQKVKNVVKIEYEVEWSVKITVNGTEVGSLSKSDQGTTGLNYTSYSWGYYDTLGVSGWPGKNSLVLVNCTGFTVASIIKTLAGLGNANYTVNFIAIDGYGTQKTFTKSAIENGFPTENATAIAGNEGKQMMLLDQYDGKALGYAEGPFWLIVPGANKGNYIKEIVEIRITQTSPNTEGLDTDGEDQIDGMSAGILFVTMSLGVIFVVISRKRKLE
jgi:hypothetical protein